MVRKISNKKEIKQQKKNAKKIIKKNAMMTSEQIDKEIQENLGLLEKYLMEEELKKIKLLTTDSSEPSTMAKIFTIIKKIRDINKNNGLTNEFMMQSKDEIVAIIDEYEKNYLPSMTTLIYLSLLGINKSISRYFNVNYYKRNFSKDNKDYKRSNESYRICNNMLKNLPIKLDKERVFTGIWEEKIKSMSKSLNKLLCRLDKFRELYIINDVIETEYKRLRKTIEAIPLNDEKELTRKECSYIKKVFGKEQYEEMVKYYSKPTIERYHYEYNLVKNILFYNAILLNERHLSILKKELINATYFNTHNTFLAEDIIQNVRNIYKEINTFVLNFSELVTKGDERFVDNLKLPVARIEGKTMSLKF